MPFHPFRVRHGTIKHHFLRPLPYSLAKLLSIPAFLIPLALCVVEKERFENGVSRPTSEVPRQGFRGYSGAITRNCLTTKSVTIHLLARSYVTIHLLASAA